MDQNTSLFEFEVDQPIAIEMTEMAKWAKLFGIIILSLIGLSVLLLVTSWSKIEAAFLYLWVTDSSSSSMLVVVIAICAILAIIAITMVFFLIRGANRIKNALQQRDQSVFNAGLGDIKAFFIFYGVIAILGLLSNLSSLIK